MTIENLQAALSALQGQVNQFAGALMEMVRARHPEAVFSDPYYWADEGVWLIHAHVADTDDFELQEQLAMREAEILKRKSIRMCMLLLPRGEPFAD